MAELHPNLFFIVVISVMLVIIFSLGIFALVSKDKGIFKAKDLKLGPGLLFFQKENILSKADNDRLKASAELSAKQLAAAEKANPKAGIVKALYGDNATFGNNSLNNKGGFDDVDFPSGCMVPGNSNAECVPL